jgi:hypothetical protein
MAKYVAPGQLNHSNMPTFIKSGVMPWLDRHKATFLLRMLSSDTNDMEAIWNRRYLDAAFVTCVARIFEYPSTNFTIKTQNPHQIHNSINNPSSNTNPQTYLHLPKPTEAQTNSRLIQQYTKK